MKVIDEFKSKTIDEFITWLDEYCSFDNAPWIKWWDENYCSKCPAEVGKYEDSDREMKFSWCELHDKCRFFTELDATPSSKDIIKMWLESETTK